VTLPQPTLTPLAEISDWHDDLMALHTRVPGNQVLATVSSPIGAGPGCMLPLLESTPAISMLVEVSFPSDRSSEKDPAGAPIPTIRANTIVAIVPGRVNDRSRFTMSPM